MELCEIFTQALQKVVPGNVVVFNYGNIEDFTSLWARNNTDGSPALLQRICDSHAIIVVWDGRELGDVSSAPLLKQHLTPLDWALAFSLAVLAETRLETLAGIYIVDLTGQRHDEWAMQMRHHLLAEMPWVTLHAPLVPDGAVFRQSYLPIVDAPGQRGLLTREGSGWRLLAPRKSLATCRERIGDLQRTARQWVASLTQSRDHHDVNNIIGPAILSRKDTSLDTLRSAFLNRLAWCGFDLEQAKGWTPWDPLPAVKRLFNRTLTILIVDDQIHQGWGRFACRLFGDRPYDEGSVLTEDEFTRIDTNGKGVAVFGCMSAEPLIKFLDRNKLQFDRRNYAEQIRTDNSPDAQPQIVLLDLRLYSQSKDAKSHARRLLNIIRFRAQGALAWRPFDQLELERIEKWCTQEGEETRVAEEALLLLPRLLALALPLTPIILFSSTGQAWIRERLKPYENVFTGFEKPRVFSDPASVEASIAALREGLDNAVLALRLRLQLAHAQRAVRQATNLRKNKLGDRLTTQHIEIYGDETRSLEEGITSGLAVCVYPTINHAEALQAKLWDQHGAAGVVWARAQMPNGGVTMPELRKGSDISRSAADCETQVALVDDLLMDADVGLGKEERKFWSVVATRVPGMELEQERVSLAAFPDGPLDDALRANLEFTLYVLIPYFCDAEFSGTVHLYLPSRVVPYNSYEFAQKLCEAFDLGEPIIRNRPPALVPTAALSHDGGLGTAFPLVRGWLHEWQSTSPVQPEQITKIKMASLGRATNRGIGPVEAANRRLFHDIADWACTASGKLYDQATRQWIWPLKEQLMNRELFPHWFVSTDGEKSKEKSKRNRGKYFFETDSRNASALMGALKASFHGSFNDRSGGDAIRLLLRNTYIETCDDRLFNSEFSAQQRLILWSIRQELEYASGRALHSLVASDAEANAEANEQLPARAAGEPKDEQRVKEVESVRTAEPNLEAKQAPVEDEEDSFPSSTAEPLSDILSEDDLARRFLGCFCYDVVNSTKFGDIFFKASTNSGSRGTHWTHDRKMAFQLQSEGWAQPVVVYGEEAPASPSSDRVGNIYAASTARRETRLKVVAVKMADGRWKAMKGL